VPFDEGGARDQWHVVEVIYLEVSVSLNHLLQNFSNLEVQLEFWLRCMSISNVFVVRRIREVTYLASFGY
jgi:hypothetical protein